MLILIAHGTTETEVAGIVGLDSTLSEAALDELDDLCEDLRQYTFDHVYASTELASLNTLEGILDSVKGTLLPGLVDRDFGLLEGLTWKECRLKFPTRKYKQWERDSFAAPPCGESLHEVGQRIETLARETILPLVRQGGSVLVVASVTVIRLMVHTIQSLPETYADFMPPRNVPIIVPLNALGN